MTRRADRLAATVLATSLLAICLGPTGWSVPVLVAALLLAGTVCLTADHQHHPEMSPWTDALHALERR